MEHLVGKSDDNLKTIQFFRIKKSYKEFTILEKQTFEANKYYVYNNKTKAFGKLHLINLPENKILKDILLNNRIEWIEDINVFFYADSKFVSGCGLEYYDTLKQIYINLLAIRYSEIKNKNTKLSLFQLLQVSFILFNSNMRKRAYIRQVKKELKVIW